jgi:hypothetical protein
MKSERSSVRKVTIVFTILAFLAVLAPPRALATSVTPTRSSNSAFDAARELAGSRLLVGIQFRRAGLVGLQQGR